MCQHRKFFKGCRVGRDAGMPEFMWGQYLNGDEPGYQCSLTGNPCPEDEYSEGECPELATEAETEEAPAFVEDLFNFGVRMSRQYLPEEKLYP